MTIPIYGVFVGSRADKQPCPVSNLLQLSGRICYQTRQKSWSLLPSSLTETKWPPFADIFKCIFFNENLWISIKISLNFIPMGPVNNIPALVQIKAWRRSGEQPLSEPMVVRLPTYICVTRPQWVYINTWTRWWFMCVAYSTEKVIPCLAKPSLKFNGGLAKLGLTSSVKKAAVRWGLFDPLLAPHSVTQTNNERSRKFLLWPAPNIDQWFH